jgi:hypothetical protein
MKKKDVFFLLICLFIVKLILLPAFFADAAVLFVLLSYRPISKFISLKENAIFSEEVSSKFEKLQNELKDLDETVRSFKTKEQIVSTFSNMKK